MAPFWDDVDTRWNSGEVSYEVYEAGYQLDYVSAFIRRRNPSNFHGTWMMVASWDAVHQYFALFSSLVCVIKKKLFCCIFWTFYIG